MTWHDVAAGEFYDLRQDPREWTNRYADADCRPERDRMGDQLMGHLNQVALPRK